MSSCISFLLLVWGRLLTGLSVFHEPHRISTTLHQALARLCILLPYCSYISVYIFPRDLLATLSEIWTLLESLIISLQKVSMFTLTRTNVLQYKALCKQISKVITLTYSNKTVTDTIHMQKGTGKNLQTMTNVLLPLRNSIFPQRL